MTDVAGSFTSLDLVRFWMKSQVLKHDTVHLKVPSWLLNVNGPRQESLCFCHFWWKKKHLAGNRIIL